MSNEIQAVRDLVAKIEAGLIARSQARPNEERSAYPHYNDDRTALLESKIANGFVPSFVSSSPTIEIAFSHMKAHASGSGSWSARRDFVRDQFTFLRQHLDVLEKNAVLISQDDIASITIPSISSQLQRAKELIAIDSGSALTKAATVLASVCQHILTLENVVFGKTDTLPSLVSKVAKGVLQLDTTLGVAAFSGISTQAQLVAETRNKYGDAHASPVPDDEVAELAVTNAGALAIFLLKRYAKKQGEL